MVFEIAVMTRGNKIFGICTSVFSFALHIAWIIFFFFPSMLSYFVISKFFSCTYRTDLFPKQR